MNVLPRLCFADVSSATVARDLSDKELVEMLQKKPRYVPQLQVHEGSQGSTALDTLL